MGAMTALIAALGMVPMAKAVGGFLIAPIVSGLLGILVWREPPTATRLMGSAISFMGAAILLRPEAGLEPGCLFALLGGALLGAYLAATRGARSQTDALSTLAVQSLLGAGLLAPFALAGGLPALTSGAPPRRARRSAPSRRSATSSPSPPTSAPTRRLLAPFLYFNLLTAMAVGFVFFGETLGWTSIVGPPRDRRRRPRHPDEPGRAGAAAACSRRGCAAA